MRKLKILPSKQVVNVRMRAKAWTSLYHEISGLNKLFTPYVYVSSFLTKQDPKLETKSFEKGVLTENSGHCLLLTCEEHLNS